MEGDDFAWYKCKLCEDTFKTTADLQKHKRLNHRNAASSSSTTSDSNLNVILSPNQPTQQFGPSITTEIQRDIRDDRTIRHGHGTRYAKSRSGDKDDTILPGGRHFTCASCSQNFDTKDAVVLHLLRQSRNESGTLKCPYCAKQLHEEIGLPATSGLAGSEKVGKSVQDTRGSTSVARRAAAKSFRSKGRHVIGDAGCNKSTKEAPSLFGATEGSVPIKKRKKSCSPATPKTIKLDNRITTSISENSVDSHSATMSSPSPAEPLASLSAGTKLSACATSTTTSLMQGVRTDEVKREFEITYRQRFGKGSRSGIESPHSGNIRTERNSINADDTSRNSTSVDAPLRVSVLINSNPYPSATRLAVPKAKEFEKGNIRCPYCGFEAKSVKEVKFHINTHMPKSYPCEFCSHVYRSKQAVMNHTEKYHAGEMRNIQAYPLNANNAAEGNKEVDHDQRSMSNYSSSLTSENIETENYFCEDSQSQESFIDKRIFPITVTNTSSNVPESLYQNCSNDQSEDQVYFPSTVITMPVDQEGARQLLVIGQEVNISTVEKVVEIANF